MGRPIEASDEDVIAAGQQLLGAGKPINGSSIRQIVGIGLPRRMAQVWQAHMESTAVAAVPPPPLDLPGALVDRRDSMHKQIGTLVDDLVTSAWKVAEEISTQRSRAEHDAARRRVAEYEDERETADANLALVDSTLADAVDELDSLRSELDAAKVEVVRMQERLAATADEHRRADEASATTIIELRARVDHADQEASAARQQAATSSAEASAAATEAERLRTELAGVRQELDVARRDHATADASLTAANLRADAASVEAGREREARQHAEEMQADLIQRVAVASPKVRVKKTAKAAVSVTPTSP